MNGGGGTVTITPADHPLVNAEQVNITISYPMSSESNPSEGSTSMEFEDALEQQGGIPHNGQLGEYQYTVACRRGGFSVARSQISIQFSVWPSFPI